MDISYHSAKPKLWAGLGRAVNNVCALMIMTLAGGFASVRYEVMIVAVILFFPDQRVGVFVPEHSDRDGA